MGINFFDSAITYGDGHSESLIGKVIKGNRDKYVITTKIPPKNYVFPAKLGSNIEDVYPADWIIECTERSLKSFDTDFIDLQHFHVWINEWTDNEELIGAVERLKKDGKIRSAGVAVNHPYGKDDNAVPGMESGLFDVVQVVYNIYQQEPESDVFKVAGERGIGVVPRCILDEGCLTGKITPDTQFPEGSFLESYFKEDRRKFVYDKAQEMNWLISEGYAENLAEAAIRFAITSPVVSSAIAGMRNPKHARANCEAAEKGPLPKEAVERLKAHAWHHDYWI